MAQCPRALDALHFAGARLPELQALEVASQRGSSTHPWAASNTQHHLRRRAASHLGASTRKRPNTHRTRLPASIPAGRRAKRRPERLALRMALPTHRWHAKRFRMLRLHKRCDSHRADETRRIDHCREETEACDKYIPNAASNALSIPAHPLGKGRNARATCLKSSHVLHDRSYMSLLVLSGPRASIGLTLKSVCGNGGDAKHGKERHMLAVDPRSQGVLCPVMVQWFWQSVSKLHWNETDSNASESYDMMSMSRGRGSNAYVAVWVHPLARDRLWESFSQVNGNRGKVSITQPGTQIGRLEIVGTNGVHSLMQCIRRALLLPSELCIPQDKGSARSITVEDPRIADIAHETFDPSVMHTDLQISEGLDLHSMLADPSPISQDTADDMRARSRRSFLAGSPLSYGEGIEMNKSMHSFTLGLVRRPSWGTSQARGRNGSDSVLTASRCREGITLIVPAAWISILWNHLVFQGFRAVGIDEWKWISICEGAPTFPEDFIDSAVARQGMLGNAQLAEQKRSKLPVRKRSGKFTSQWIRMDCIAHSQDLLLDSQADKEHPPYARTLKDLASHLWGSSRRHPVETGLLCHENLCWTPRESVPQGDCLVRVQVLQRFGGNFPEGAKCCALADNELHSLLSEGKARMAVDHRLGRRALGFVSKSVPPGLSPSRFECTATCSARELWRSRVDQFGCGGSTAAADLYIVLEDRNGLQGTRLRPQLACARICLEWCKYDVAQW